MKINMNKKIITICAGFLGVAMIALLAVSSTYAEIDPDTSGSILPPSPNDFELITNSFKNVKTFEATNINVPTVVEVGISMSELEDKRFAVYESSTDKFIPNLFKENYSELNKNIVISETGNSSNTFSEITDGKYETYSEFQLPAASQGTISLDVIFSNQIRTNSLQLSLGKYVSLPTRISIYHQNSDGELIASLAPIKPNSTVVNFPEVTTEKLVVEMVYAQPLRITELAFNDLDSLQADEAGIRFLAKPGSEYSIYFNSDRYERIMLEESGNLSKNDGIVYVDGSDSTANDLYVPADSDGDGIIDQSDNCVKVPNPDQIDVDSNGRGDVCDDFDRDGIINMMDNCQNDPNRGQGDIDNDGIGDVCDGEESRITEKYPALVWGGIIFAVIIFIILYFVAIRSMRKEKAKIKDLLEEE